MEKETLENLRTLIVAANQARAIIDVDDDCSFTDTEMRNLKKEMANNEEIIHLTKKYNEGKPNNGDK